METFLLQIVRWFLERQMQQFGESTDFAKVKEDLQKRVADLLPGTVYDATAQYIVSVFIDIVAAYFSKDGEVPSLSDIPKAVEYANMNLTREMAMRNMSKV